MGIASQTILVISLSAGQHMNSHRVEHSPANLAKATGQAYDSVTNITKVLAMYSNVQTRFTVLLALCAAIVLALAMFSLPARAADDAATIELGKERFGEKCGGFCHGAGGKGARHTESHGRKRAKRRKEVAARLDRISHLKRVCRM